MTAAENRQQLLDFSELFLLIVVVAFVVWFTWTS